MDPLVPSELDASNEGRRAAWDEFRVASRGEMLDELFKIMEGNDRLDA